MEDKWTEVFENYDVTVKSCTKGRYAQIAETDIGVLQLRPQTEGEGRLKSEFEFKELLFDAGFENTDRLIYNRDEKPATPDRYGTMYVLRRFFCGREINVTNMSEIDMAVENLAKLHLAGRRVFSEKSETLRLPVVRDGYDLEKRNREMKRVRAYIAKQHVKSKFEEVYLSVYERFYGQAQEGLKQLEELVKNTAVCQSIPDKSSAAYTVIPECFENHIGYCHGDYNNHNVLVTGKEKKVATIGFDKFYVGNQLADLYYFARKCVEKNGYNFDVLRRIITEYNSYINLSEADLAYIGILFAYPEKFYKLGNRYLNGSKVRISPVMHDKLKKIIESESKKQKILSKYCEIFLHI